MSPKIDNDAIILVNKSDKLTKNNMKLKNTLLQKKDIIFISLKEGFGIDQLLDSLNLGTEEPYSEFNPEKEDLGDWFMGCPSWLARS